MSRRAAVLVLLGALACSPRIEGPPRDDDPRTATVDEARAVIRTGPIGASKPHEASYVLVDVTNTSAKDRLVTVGGALVDDAGAEVAALAADELRVPAGGARTFALITQRPAPTARRARFHVANAVAVDYPPQVVIEDQQTKLGDLAVASAVARNTIDKDATAVIAAAYHGKDGAILARPFTVVPLPAGATHRVRFEGPRESARVTVFVGQIAFHH
jgi:hypothetical protein